MFYIKIGYAEKEFTTYEEAVLFCGENKIHPEEIFEEDE